ncbi:SPR1-exo-1 3-beta-glucanase precursor [Apiospora rasikravindrae]|uniref:SPR1-exo-1 3-beta-glucanase n=1 Tax=Apiospora rasikravindrae TaxID=990691 RepID=A0ABR1TA76_9PEZI
MPYSLASVTFGGLQVSKQVGLSIRFWAPRTSEYWRVGGCLFWTWKCNWLWGSSTDDWRWCWCYESAVANGVVPDEATTDLFHPQL